MKLTDTQMFTEFLLNMVKQRKFTEKQSFQAISDVWFQVFQYELGYKRLVESIDKIGDSK